MICLVTVVVVAIVIVYIRVNHAHTVQIKY